MTILLIILVILFLLAGLFIPKEFENSNKKKVSMIAYKRGCKVTAFVFTAFALIWTSYYSVPAGYRGVLLQYGAVNGVLSEGAHFVVPFVQQVELLEVRTQKEEATASAASRDLQNVSAKVAINYHLEPRAVGDLYKSVGPAFASRIIDPATQETVKAVVANYTAEDLVRLRSTVKEKIDTGLTERLAKYDIIVETGGVSLTNFDFSEEFNTAIESKQVAQQTAEKQKYVLQQAQMEAETAITKAKGEAEANRIKGQALNSQGGSKVLTREWIEKWDGHLPTVSGNGQGMILDLRELMSSGMTEEPAK